MKIFEGREYVGWYILENRIPRKATLDEFALWDKEGTRIVKQTPIGFTRISTVFLGLDHNYGEGKPLLFETMIFSNERYDGYQERYVTWKQADMGHTKAVKLVSSRNVLHRFIDLLRYGKNYLINLLKSLFN